MPDDRSHAASPPLPLDRTLPSDAGAGEILTALRGEDDFAGAPRDAALPSYAVARTIGLGGMGEVVVARDMRIGRDVAIKRLRSPSPSPAAVARFLREARIQALLDHPAIVPVHEIGTDAAGQPYFAMKRLSGMTLARVLEGGDRPLQQLLRAFADVCLAISFAHERGVVHRDLKPSNIMLGAFGEVYVIDWGVARVIGHDDLPAGAEQLRIDAGMTEAGTLLGTPGYMAPEQVRGPDVDAPADVYALGATLFEILAGAPLHPRDAAADGRGGADGRGAPDVSPRGRRPERGIPPELDAITVAALLADPAERPTARQLADAVQRYLDGDRDVERRRALAARELAWAQLVIDGGDVGQRGEAILSAGRALALDPESREAAALITTLMLEPPRELPPELREQLAASETALQQRQGRVAMRSLIAVQAFLAAAALDGLRDAPALLGIAGWGLLMLGIAYVISRRPAAPYEMWGVAVGNAILGALLSRLFGPLIIAPVVGCVMAVSLTSYPRLLGHARIVIPMLAAAWLLPVALEWAGVLAPTWQVLDGVVVSTSHVVRVGGTATVLLLVGGNAMAIVVIGAFANSLARSRHEAQRAVEIQAWRLRQLLPAA